jgi:hypothetical protein
MERCVRSSGLSDAALSGNVPRDLIIKPRGLRVMMARPTCRVAMTGDKTAGARTPIAALRGRVMPDRIIRDPRGSADAAQENVGKRAARLRVAEIWGNLRTGLFSTGCGSTRRAADPC